MNTHHHHKPPDSDGAFLHAANTTTSVATYLFGGILGFVALLGYLFVLIDAAQQHPR